MEKAGVVAQLKAKFASGGGELKIGGRTIVVEPGLPYSGMTLQEENGFVVGRAAFASDEELTKTLLHETHRLVTTQSKMGVTRELVREETDAAHSFADRAYDAFFRNGKP